MVDPEYRRWKNKYPKFPGVAKCVELLRRGNVRGTWVDTICAELQENAADHAAELIAAFRDAESGSPLRRTLLGIISEARLPQALPVFVENLGSEDESLQHSSEQGLRALNTRESRKALWEAGRSS
jgi:hypothetical protein